MKQKYREIELKYPITNPDEVLARLTELGASPDKQKEIQEDIYYVPPHRDFLAESIVSEWLRVRLTDKGASLNYKRWLPVGAEVQTHCDEFESPVGDSHAIRLLLQALDFREIVTVKKERSTWKIGDIEVALDSVIGLGSFIELEATSALGDEEDVESVRQQLKEMLETLQAHTLLRDKRGYPYQLLNRDK